MKIRSAGGTLSAGALVLFLALGAGVLLEERLPVGDRDLVVVGMDLAEGEEAVPVAAVLDEGSLQRRLDPDHLREIDVPAKLAPVSGFEVELLDLLTADDHDPGLFRVRGIDKHLVGHDELSAWRPAAGPRVGSSRLRRPLRPSRQEGLRTLGGCCRSPLRALRRVGWGRRLLRARRS